MFYLHIERTGGTTMRSIMQRQAQIGAFDFWAHVDPRRGRNGRGDILWVSTLRHLKVYFRPLQHTKDAALEIDSTHIEYALT